MTQTPAYRAAPVVPNASQICGRLVDIQREPDGQGSVWEIVVDEARDVQGLPNFARAYSGQPIRVYVHPQLHVPAAPTDTVSATVAYRGDEQGGRFVVIDDELRKL